MTLVWDIGLQLTAKLQKPPQRKGFAKAEADSVSQFWSLLWSLLLGKEKFSRRSPAVHPGEHKYVCADLGEKQKAKTNWHITPWFVVWQQCLTFCFPEPRKWVQRNNAPPLVARSSLRIWHHPGETKSDTSLVTASPKLQYFRACFYLFLHASSRAYKAKKRKKEKEDESTCNQAL